MDKSAPSNDVHAQTAHSFLDSVFVEVAGRVTPTVPVAPAPSAPSVSQPRRRGPKYQVLPGSSRPLQRLNVVNAVAPPANATGTVATPTGDCTQKSAAAPPRELVVLEFRSEPRVVPASRQMPGAPRAAERGTSVTKNAERGNSSTRCFRPRSRQWAVERDMLAARR